MKKLIAAVLALTLFLSLSFSAPAEGRLSTLMESLHSLLFSTINVTISGEAVFSLNGERFKTAEILYKQAGEDSHWQLDLKTPRRYRADQETGFTIIANGEKLYVMERYWPGTYTTGSDQPNSTVISQSTHADLLYSLFLSLADEMEALLPENALVFPETEEEGRVTEISLSEETTPAVVNTSLNLAADFLLRRFMGVNYDSVRNWGQGHAEDYTTVTQAVLYSTDFFVLGDTTVSFTEDAKGRITGVSGTITALLSSEEFSREVFPAGNRFPPGSLIESGLLLTALCSKSKSPSCHMNCRRGPGDYLSALGTCGCRFTTGSLVMIKPGSNPLDSAG